MKKIFKLIITILVISCSVFPVIAFDFGGLVNNNTKFSGENELNIDQTDTGILWFRVPFNSNGNIYLASEGNFKYHYTENINNLFTADLSLFKLGGIFNLDNNKFILSVGRFFTTDISTIVFAQNNDGINLLFSSPWINFNVFGGYTGLLNAQNVTILNDINSTYTFDGTKIYAFAAPYVTSELSISFPYLFANQTIELEASGFFGVGDDTLGYNRLYGTISLNGPISSSIFYSVISTFGTDNEFDTIGNLSQISINWYPSFKSASVNLKGIYASGKQGPFSVFKGFTSTSATAGFTSGEYQGLTKAGLLLTLKPISALYLEAGCDVVLENIDESFDYSGFQWNASIKCNIFSDVLLNVHSEQFIGMDNNNNNLAITGSLTISF